MQRSPTPLSELQNTALQRLQDWKNKVTPFYIHEYIERKFQEIRTQVLETINEMPDFPSNASALCSTLIDYFRNGTQDEIIHRLRTIFDLMGFSQEKFLRMVHVLRKIELTKPLASQAQWIGDLTSSWTMKKIVRLILTDDNFAKTIAELLIKPQDKLGPVLPEYIANVIQFPLNRRLKNRIANDRAYKKIRNEIGKHLQERITNLLNDETIECDGGKFSTDWARRDPRHEDLTTQYPTLSDIRAIDIYIPSRLSPRIAVEIQFGETTSQGMRTKARNIARDFEQLRDIFPNLHTFTVVDGAGWEVLNDNDLVQFFNVSEVYTISEISEMVVRITQIIRQA